MSDDFVRDLEAELVAAARFRAAHPRRRFALPRRRLPPRRALLTTLATVAAAALVIAAVLAVTRGADERIANEPPAPPPPATVALPGMLPAPSCPAAPATNQPAAERLPPMAIFDRPQREPDGMPIAPSRLPVTGFDPRESRRPGLGRLKTELTLVPAAGVRRGTGCTGDDGPGLCIVAGVAQPPGLRCFTRTDIAAGRAVAGLGPTLVVGVVPDGVAEVTLAAGDERVTAPVVENAFEATLKGARPGAQVSVTLGPARDEGCRREVAPELRDRVTALLEPAQPGLPLPPAALEAVEAEEGRGAVVLDGARLWGGGDGVDFWVVPVVARGAGDCAPATRVCVVAVAGEHADPLCVSGPEPGAVQWRFSLLRGGRSAFFGVVPDRATAVDISVGDRTADVHAGLNVAGGVLPFRATDDGGPQPELVLGPVTGEPRVAVLDAGGDAPAIRDRLEDAGYETTAASMTPQERAVVYWDQRRVTREDAARVAGAVSADDRVEIRDGRPIPPEVRAVDAPVVVVVGSA